MGRMTEAVKADLLGMVLRERDDARRWARAWKESARAIRWNYTEAMRQYNAQQKRVCEAEAQVEALREALEGFSYGGPVLDDQGRELEDYCRIRLDHAFAITDWLIRTPPAALAELEARVREEERERCASVIDRYVYKTKPKRTGAVYEALRFIICAIREADDA